MRLLCPVTETWVALINVAKESNLHQQSNRAVELAGLTQEMDNRNKACQRIEHSRWVSPVKWVCRGPANKPQWCLFGMSPVKKILVGDLLSAPVREKNEEVAAAHVTGLCCCVVSVAAWSLFGN